MKQAISKESITYEYKISLRLRSLSKYLKYRRNSCSSQQRQQELSATAWPAKQLTIISEGNNPARRGNTEQVRPLYCHERRWRGGEGEEQTPSTKMNRLIHPSGRNWSFRVLKRFWFWQLPVGPSKTGKGWNRTEREGPNSCLNFTSRTFPAAPSNSLQKQPV